MTATQFAQVGDDDTCAACGRSVESRLVVLTGDVDRLIAHKS